MQSTRAAPTGARCAIHQERLADGVCPRCGSFTCIDCLEGGTAFLCPRCRQTIGAFPYSRNDFDFSRVWGFVFERGKQELTMLGVCAFIFVMLGGVGSVVSNVLTQPAMIALRRSGLTENAFGPLGLIALGSIGGAVVNVVVQGIGQMGLYRVVIDVLQGRKADINRMFSQVRKLQNYVGLQLAIMFGLGLPVLLVLGGAVAVGFLVTGASFSASGFERAFSSPVTVLLFAGALVVVMVGLLYITLPLTFAPWELVYGDTDPVEAVRRAWQLGTGFRLETFGYGLAAGLAAMAIILAGVLAVCVGVIVAVPLALALQHLIIGGLYLSLRNGSGLPAPPQP